MGKTPNAQPGPRYSEKIKLYDQSQEPDAINFGEIFYTDGDFYVIDSYGQFKLRQSENLNEGITEEEHENLNTLTHNIAKTSFDEVLYVSNKVSKYIVWTNSNKIKKIREEEYIYSGSLVRTLIIKQYNDDGNLIKTITENYTYINSRVTSVLRTVS